MKEEERKYQQEEALDKGAPRFGTIAVNKGLLTPEQLKKAIAEQIDEDLTGMGHRLLGRILLEKGLLTYQEIEFVLNEIYTRKRDTP